MELKRISAGRYQDPKTGKIHNLATPKDVAAMNKKLYGGGASKSGASGGTKLSRAQPSLTDPLKRETELGVAVGGKLGQNVSDAQKINTENIAAGNLGTNANIQGPLGSQNTTVDPVTGQATTTQALSQPQQGLLDQGQKLSSTGNQIAQGQLEGMGQFNFDQSQGGRQKMADSVFNQLSRGMDTRHAQQKQDSAQSLYDRGIQFSNDPNSRYQQELKSMEQGQSDERLSYANQAYQSGLGEQQAQFGMSQGQRQQQMSDLGSFQQQGTGLMMPNFQATQGTASDLGSMAQLGQQQQQLGTQDKVADATLKKLQTSGRGGSSGSGTQTTSPFG